MVPERKVTTDKGVIYIAEGYFNSGREVDYPHFKTLWAVAKNKLDVAQPLYFEFKAGMPTKEERLDKAELTAWEYLNA